MVVQLVLCENKIFVKDGVEEKIDAFFKKKNYKAAKIPLSSVSEIDTALMTMQEKVDGYVDYFCKQIPISIRKMIKDATDKNLPKHFNIKTMSPTKYLISDYNTRNLQNDLERFYSKKINQMQSIIIYHYNYLALNIPAFRGIFNITFFKDRFFDNDTRYPVLVNLIKNAARIAAEKTSLSADFLNYFDVIIDSRFIKMNEIYKERVRFMFDILQKNINVTKYETQNRFSVIDVTRYVAKTF
ncbi:hypothetical protein COBT_000597 [Conglomerata obtusa]